MPSHEGRQIPTHLLGPAYCIHAAIPLMHRRCGGDIVNVSPECTRTPFPFLSAYAAKSALGILSAGLRNELGPDTIRVIVFRAGHMTRENASLKSWPPGRLEQFIDSITKTGHLNFTGAGVSPATEAQALVAALPLPREANIDLLELRSI